MATECELGNWSVICLTNTSLVLGSQFPVPCSHPFHTYKPFGR